MQVIFLSLTCGYVRSSGFHPVAVPGTAPIVTAASSQYFERTFNRLVAAPLNPVVPVAPVFPVLPAPPVVQHIPAVPPPPVVVDAKRTTSIPVTPTLQPQGSAVDPNVAIAIATAHAAAPVATILLPPYPFGLPPTFGFVPQTQQPEPTTSENSNNNRESTTSRTTVQIKTTTEREPQDLSTSLPSNIDNSFAQALPSNQNVNFKQYLAPPLPTRPQPLPPVSRPQKFKTNVEVVPVPLAYIAPPPLSALHHHHHHQHHHHHHHQHQALKLVPHIHKLVPKTRIIVRPVTSHRIRVIKTPVGFTKYGPPNGKKLVKRYPKKN